MGNTASYEKRIKFNVIVNNFEANALLNVAEKSDYYLEECHDDKLNSIARRTLTYSPNVISTNEVSRINSFLESVELPQRLHMDLDTVNIIQLMPSADGGMPHTRPGEIICFPDISQLFSQTTLIHELWHIHQRKYQNEWLDIFKHMGWNLWSGELPEHLEKHRRYNPDTLDCPLWIFDNTWVPLPIFRNITRPKVEDVDIWFYNPNKNYHVRQVPQELNFIFSNLKDKAYEHPREIAAYMLSEPERYKNSIGFKHLLEAIGATAIINNGSRV